MKKVLALLALVAMIAVASVASAEDVNLSVGVTNANVLDVADCTATPLSVSFATADYTTTQTDNCIVNVTAGAVWDLDGEDTDDGAEPSAGAIPCTATCSVGTDDIDGGGDANAAVTAGIDGGEYDYWMVNTGGNVTVDACTAAAGCEAGVTADNIVVDGDPVIAEAFTFDLEVAVDNVAPVQPAGTYADVFTLTLT